MPARAQVPAPTLTVTPLRAPVGTGWRPGSLADEAGVWEDGFPTDPEVGPLPGPGYSTVEADCVDESDMVLFSYDR